MQRRLIPFVLAALAGGLAAAQEDDLDTTNTQVSLGYEYTRTIKERLRGFGDLIYEERTDEEFFSAPQAEVSLTGGVSYDLTKRIRIDGGLGLYYVYRSGLADTFEIRPWQTVTFDWPDSLGKVRRYVLQHRFRLEERFRNTEGWDFAFRLRYRLSFSIPLNKYTVEPGAFFVPLRAEFFVPLGDDVEELFTKNRRWTVGLGYVFGNSWSVQLRYGRLEMRDTTGAGFETTDHYIEFRLGSAFRIRDLLKSR